MIRSLRNKLGYSQEELGNLVGVSQPTVVQWEKGNRYPTRKSIPHLAKIFSLSPADLTKLILQEQLQGVRGGNELANVASDQSNLVEEERLEIVTGNVKSLRRASKEIVWHLPLISVKGRASVIEHSLEGCQLNFIEETYTLYFPVDETDGTHVIIEIGGDSMEPEIRSGAFVMAKCVDKNDIKYESNGVYAVLYANRFVVKRIKSNDINERKKLVLHSDNDKYGPITIEADEIRCMWKILRIVDSPVR